MAACIDYFSCDGIPDDEPETDLPDDDSQRDEPDEEETEDED